MPVGIRFSSHNPISPSRFNKCNSFDEGCIDGTGVFVFPVPQICQVIDDRSDVIKAVIIDSLDQLTNIVGDLGNQHCYQIYSDDSVAGDGYYSLGNGLVAIVQEAYVHPTRAYQIR